MITKDAGTRSNKRGVPGIYFRSRPTTEEGGKIWDFPYNAPMMRLEQHIFEHVYCLYDLQNLYCNASYHTVDLEQYLLTSQYAHSNGRRAQLSFVTAE